MSNSELKAKIDYMLFDLERKVKVDKKGKVSYKDLFEQITKVRIEITKL